MEVNDVIVKRRSVRSYTGELITDEQLRTIIRAGAYAPSARNKKPIEYIVIDDEGIINKIMEFQPYTKMLAAAKTGILVCADLEKETEKGFAVQDGSAAIQNMLLTAYDLGLGAVWCGIDPITKFVKGMRELLDIPAHILPIGLVVVGNCDNIDREVNERLSESMIHRNKW